MKNKLKILKVILIVLFTGCLFDMPYGYYELVRFFGVFGFIYLAHTNYQNGNRWWCIWSISALLINPFLRISLDKITWNIIDIIWVVLLITSMFKLLKDKILK